jgi:hypothetical protein
MHRPGKMSASSTIPPKQSRAAEQGDPAASTGVAPQPYCHQNNATGYLAGILLKALEQGQTERRLAHLESILGCNKGADGEMFHFVAKGTES